MSTGAPNPPTDDARKRPPAPKVGGTPMVPTLDLRAYRPDPSLIAAALGRGPKEAHRGR